MWHWLVIGLLLGLSLSGCERRSDRPVIVVEREASMDAMLSKLVGDGTPASIAFADVVAAACNKRIIPVDPHDPIDAEILGEIDAAVATAVQELRSAKYPRSHRINSLAPELEVRLKELLNQSPILSCDYGRRVDGKLLRAGYPDLRVRHGETGRVIYIEPKLVAADALDSSLRTFYFAAKPEAERKILHDGWHLLLGIEYHAGQVELEFFDWHLVDLSQLRCFLKAEFHAGNSDIYQPEMILPRQESEQ